LAFAFAAQGLLQGQVADVTGEWSVARQPSPLKPWLRALPGAVFTLTPSAIPPLAMVRRGLGYTYFPSRPTIAILEGPPDKPRALGFLQPRVGRRFEGERRLRSRAAQRPNFRLAFRRSRREAVGYISHWKSPQMVLFCRAQLGSTPRSPRVRAGAA
jgi:hypothetical protein